MNCSRSGLLAVALAAWFAAPAAAGPIIADPLNDRLPGNPAGPDVVGISADVLDNPGFATLRVIFSGPISAPSSLAGDSVLGIIDIDADRNPLTGQNPSLSSGLAGTPPFNLGAELSIDLYSELFNSFIFGPGFVDVTDGSGTTVLATVPITFGANEFTVLLPNSLFGSGTPTFNYAAVFGDFLAPSDRVPNGAAPLVSTPEPVSAAVLGALCLAAGGYYRRRRAAAAG